MYIKRAPLGQGNLTFRGHRRRYSLILLIVYLAILAVALYIYWRADTLRPEIAALIGPEPTPTPSVEELLQKGYAAYMEGSLSEAADYYQQAVQVEPENIQILTDLSRVLTLSFQLEEALAVSEQIIQLDPEDPRGHAAKSRALDWMGEFDKAEIEALRAVELDPDYALGHAYLAEAYNDLGRWRQAREQAELAIHLDPFNVDARRNYALVLEYQGYYEGAIQQYIQALQIHPNLLDLWYGLARNYRGTGQYDLSVDTYAKIIIRTPDDPLPYIEMGKTYFEVRDDGAAQEYFEAALERIEQMTEAGEEVPSWMRMSAWKRLAMVYYTRRNFEYAIETFDEAIAWGEANEPDAIPLEAYYVTAAAYYYLDECREAVPRARQALVNYEEKRLDDPAALENILKVFVLCRDYANEPYVYTGAGFVNGFPEGYEEPDVYLELPGSGGENASGEGE